MSVTVFAYVCFAIVFFFFLCTLQGLLGLIIVQHFLEK